MSSTFCATMRNLSRCGCPCELLGTGLAGCAQHVVSPPRTLLANCLVPSRRVSYSVCLRGVSLMQLQPNGTFLGARQTAHSTRPLIRHFNATQKNERGPSETTSQLIYHEPTTCCIKLTLTFLLVPTDFLRSPCGGEVPLWPVGFLSGSVSLL